MKKRVAILSYPNLCTFEFACAVELFALPRPEIKHWYQTDIVSLQTEAVSAIGGFQVQSDIVFSKEKGFSDYDMLVIAGWSGLDIDLSDELLSAIKDFYKNGGRLVSFCSGAFALAATGLLDNQKATTHWRYEEQFKQKFPRVQFQENVLYTENNNLYTSAGSASGLDLGLHIIRQDFGAGIANKIAKRLVISPQREGGQAQYANKEMPQKTNHLSKSLEWANKNLHRNIHINQMAEHAFLTRRSFDRHFRSTLGLSPKEWITRQRISLAREYLENSKASIEEIAEKSGFGTAMNLRHHFSHVLGVSPSHYRRQFLL
ncbi:MAG: helix-turn-helix domain-containing protein [Cocleimonas sp.]